MLIASFIIFREEGKTSMTRQEPATLVLPMLYGLALGSQNETAAVLLNLAQALSSLMKVFLSLR